MKAAAYASKGPARDVLSLVERPSPEPTGDEVRVKLAFSGVNPSDVKTRLRPGMDYPEVIPHSDGAGVVDEAVGDVTPQGLPRIVQQCLVADAFVQPDQEERDPGPAPQQTGLQRGGQRRGLVVQRGPQPGGLGDGDVEEGIHYLHYDEGDEDSGEDDGLGADI